IAGHLVDEGGQPLPGCSLRARIWENNALFETNAVTGADGAFVVAAVPAVWSFCCLEPATNSGVPRVLGERLVEVHETNIERQIVFTAPTATSTLSVTLSNLAGCDVVAETERF